MTEEKNLMEEFGENEIFETPTEDEAQKFSSKIIKKMIFEDKIKGDLLIVSGDLNYDDSEKRKSFEKETKKEFTKLERYFRVNFFHVFLGNGVNDVVNELHHRSFVFFLDSVPEEIVNEFVLSIGKDKLILFYTEKNTKILGVKKFEYSREKFLLCEKQELWKNSEN